MDKQSRWWCVSCKQWITGAVRAYSRNCPELRALRIRVGILKPNGRPGRGGKV